MNIRTDSGLSAALDCSVDAFEDLQDGGTSGPRDEPRDTGTARSYLRDAAWAGSQWR
ncbi:hypothetical protein [Arthrobacter sp. H41]|uniref:hypothetical protein n=1 Tax=Arthrobacter sp. H41 TaxID=1312978 RepID=UPI0012DDA0FB|nr:hypothetical protein [Arthrobacter sp. H41]